MESRFSIQSQTPDCLSIAIRGCFDYNTIPDLSLLYNQQHDLPSKIIIDLSNTVFIDGSALGMLMLLRRRAGGDTAKIILKNPNNNVLNILRITHLDEIFEIQLS